MTQPESVPWSEEDSMASESLNDILPSPSQSIQNDENSQSLPELKLKKEGNVLDDYLQPTEPSIDDEDVPTDETQSLPDDILENLGSLSGGAIIVKKK